MQSAAQFKNRLPRNVRQMVKFGSVGVLNTLLDASLYFILTRWLGMMNTQILAKAISYSAGILNSFYWNKTWTFRSQKRPSWAMFGVFVLLNVVSLSINAGVMDLCLHSLHLSELFSLVLATLAAMGWNFFTTRKFVF
jgi:putative flippase GtrA